MACAALGCSSASNEAGGGGTGGLGGAGGSRGSRGENLSECELEGYPCSPADMSPEARALSHQYVDAVRERLDAGESFEEVGDWLAAQGDIAHVLGDSVALRFRVTGGSAQWFYDPPSGIARPVPSEPAPAATGSTPSVGLKAVVREDDDEDRVKKRALFIEPFEEFIETPTGQWNDKLNELHDYEQVDHLVNQSVSDEYFRNWDDYRFVWVTTHGKHLPTDSPTYSALFSSRMCEESGWLRTEVEAGRGDELTRGGTTSLRALFGFPRGFVLESLTPEQAERLEQHEIAETPELDGIHCGNLEMDWIFVPGYQPGDGALTDVIIKYWFYDDTWFRQQFGGGLENAVVYQRACTSDKLPLEVASGSRGAILGWSDTINSADDDLTIGVLFDELITKGETLQYALERVFDAGFHRFTRGEKNPTLEVVSEGAGQRQIRVREIIAIVDPVLGLPLPDEGGVLKAKEINSEGHTLVDVPVEVAGFGQRSPDEFSIRIFDGQGEPLSSAVPAEDRFMMIPIEIPEGVAEPKEFDIEARVSLPEGPELALSKHPITVTIEPPGDCRFSVRVAGTEVTGQSKDVATFQSEDFGDGALIGINLEQSDGGRGVFFGSLLGDEFPRVLGPGTFVGGVSGTIGLQGSDMSFYNDGPTVTLLVNEYVPGEVLRGEFSGTVLVLGPPPDDPEREEDLLITFEINVPPDFVPFLGYYYCTIP